jgi:hypothetical protein
MIYASAANTPARLGIGSTDQILKVSGGVPVWATPASASPASASATVATSQGTTSSGYTDLATAGPAVTLTTGTKVLVIISAFMYNNVSDGRVYMDFGISGATTRSATDSTALGHWSTIANGPRIRHSSASFVTVTAGSNTFTAKYRRDYDGTATFENREITVIDLGS